MTVGSLVERIELADRTATWIVAHRRRLAPVFWIVATLTPLIVFWIGPLMLQDFAVREARSAPADWIESGRVPGGRAIAPREFLTGLRQLGPPPHLPDLSANGLEIGHVSFVSRGDGQPGAIHVGYANDSGCRISLWITSAGVPGTGPLVEQHRGVAFSWRVDGLRYIIVRSGMRQERFHLLAESARATTLARARLHGPKRTALAVSAMFGRPCTS
jgi:hypothetical protein